MREPSVRCVRRMMLADAAPVTATESDVVLEKALRIVLRCQGASVDTDR